MDGDGKLLLISFSSAPAADRHYAVVTGTVRALNRIFETIDIITIKGEFLAHIERFHNSRLLRVPLVGDEAVERAESFRRAVIRQIDSDSYDVVHVRSPLEGIPICQLRDERGFRVVYEAGSFAHQDASNFLGNDETIAALEAQLSRDEITCASQADLVIVGTEAAGRALQTRGVVRQVEVIPSGVNIDVFDWEYAVEPQVPTLLCIGRLVPWRDVDVVLEALRRVLEVTPVCLRWFGDGDPELCERYRAKTIDLGIEHAVSFESPPDVNDLPSQISASTICLAPHSPTERLVEWGEQPQGLLEFMACQRPVIAARGPGVEEVVRDGTEAMLYTPGDPASLTSSVLFQLRNPRHRRLLAKRGYHRVREQYGESAQRRQVLQAYRELLGIAHGFGRNQGDLSKDSTPPSLPPTPANTEQEPVTAVMHAAEESRSVRIDEDTSQIKSAIEEPFDTQPSIVIDQHDEPHRDDHWTWGVSDSAPPEVAGVRPETRKLPAIPPAADDTSRFTPQDLPKDSDPDDE